MINISNKPGWIVYKFEDFVENIREQVMPTKEDSKKYIGLEHLDSGSLHVRRWGTKIQLKGTKFRMKKGDLLFARRNAYLRRVAIAPHDGLFSAHGMIFRSKNDIISPDFLPFFLSSDVFMNRAIKISVGSLSPTINWGTLRHEEFSLPPLDEQKRLADLLWSVDETTERKREMCKSLATFCTSFLEETCNKAKGRENRSINDICNINKNNLPSNTDPEYEFRYLDITSIIGPNMLCVLEKYFFKNAPSRARRMVEKDNIVLSLVRPYHRAFVLIEEDCKDLIASTGTAVLEASKTVDRDYLFHIFFSRNFLQFCEQRMTGTNYPAITPTDLKQYKLFLPSLKEQGIISKKLSLIKKIEKDIGREIDNLVNIKRQIINQIFGEKS